MLSACEVLLGHSVQVLNSCSCSYFSMPIANNSDDADESDDL